MATELIPHSAWAERDTRGPEQFSSFAVRTTRLHHTVTAYIEPEPYNENEVDYTRPAHLGILWTGQFKPGWTTKAKVLRRYRQPHEARGGKFNGQEVPGVRKWGQMETRRRGDGGWVIVQIDPKRIADNKALRKQNNAVRLAAISRVKAAERRAMRSMDAYHKRVFSSRGLGYTEVVFPSGRVYEGRGLRWGAHTLGHNRDFGLSMAGDYRNKAVPQRMRQAIIDRIRARKARSAVPHRATYGTSCPGVSDSFIANLNADL